MEITEEQRKRAEANRLAALEKQKRAAEAALKGEAWKLSKCLKTPSSMHTGPGAPLPQAEKKALSPPPPPPPPPPDRFRVILEICSAEEFSVTPKPVSDSPFPGETECFKKIAACLSSIVVVYHIDGMGFRQASVYKLEDYEIVSRCLKKLHGLQLQEVPYTTRAAIKRSCYYSAGDRWTVGRAAHLSDDKIDELVGKLPKLLRDALLPFQLEGVRFGLRRGGCCLIADEMGLGKSIQAIAIACCFMNEGPILVVCPAILRFSWAEELEHWLPFCLPTDIHLVFGHQNNVDHLEIFPKIVVISFTMLHRLRRSMLKRRWALVIVDESHNIRCTKKTLESEETKAVIDVASNSERIILLSGTPSLSRPYDIYHQINILWPKLLGKDKYEFANNYCSVRLVRGSQGKVYKDFSKGVRLEELNILLRQTVMIRRLKEHVLAQLPPKRRQIIRLMLKGADILLATAACRASDMNCIDNELLNDTSNDIDGDRSSNILNECSEKNGCQKTAKQLSYQEIGLAKLSGFREWLSNYFTVNDTDAASSLELDSQKMIIFAHHLKVLDGIQEFVCEKGIQFIRIDGSTLARDRRTAVEAFHLSKEVKIAIIGITAGGVGLDFSSAQNVVFLELPKAASDMLQAEDRAHRRGQINAVNIYIFCAKGTSDESHWLHLNKSLYRVSSMMNGKDDAIKAIEIDRICHLGFAGNIFSSSNQEVTCTDDPGFGTSVDQRMQVDDKDKYEDFEARANEQTEANSKFSFQTASLQLEANRLYDLDMEKNSASYGNIECHDSEDRENGTSGSVSVSKLDKDNKMFETLRGAACKTFFISNGEPSVPSYISLDEGMQTAEVHTVVPEEVGDRVNELIKPDANHQVPADSLRFEVSQHTGRIHLYVFMLGEDLRPRPLFENFRPEEIESMLFSGNDIKEAAPRFMKENPIYRDVFQTFIKEWSDLRPVQRNKLLGKPLQLPLSIELCYLKDSINHGHGGLLKGGSKRRTTPLSDISRPLPENAVCKKITLHRGSTKEKEYVQAWTQNNEPLCKLCQTICSGKLAKAPEFFKDLFCNLSCFQEFRIRTSQRFLREALFQVEHGICTECKLDCHKLVECIRPLSAGRRQEYIEKLDPKLANKKKLLEKLVWEPIEGNAWHADHIVPVFKGGGECRLENMRTLCVACHSEVTAAQRAERRLMRIRAKEQLKIAIKEVQDRNSSKTTHSSSDVDVLSEDGEGVEDDGLFIEVPGSAYASKEGTHRSE